METIVSRYFFVHKNSVNHGALVYQILITVAHNMYHIIILAKWLGLLKGR